MNKPRRRMPEVLHLLLLIMCTSSLSVCAQESTFRVGDVNFDKRTFTVSGQKEAAAGDLNGDGYHDIVIAAGETLTILWGDGNGNLSRPDLLPVGQQGAVSPALADLNEDGHVDVAVANHETHYLTLLLGDGTGAFQPAPNSPLTINVDPHPHAVRAADLDGDGLTDLIVDHRDGEGLLILSGLGDGEFQSPGTLVDAGGDPYRGMAIGDLNGDGQSDLVTPNPNAVGVMFSTDPHRLAFSQESLPTEGGPFYVDLADLNDDGHMDVVAAINEGSALVQLFLGDGQGAFREADSSPFTLGTGGKWITHGDFNGDGVQDAVISCWNASDLLLLLGGSDSIQTSTLPGGENPWGLTAADLNEDGTDDLVIPEAGSDRVTIYLSRNE